MDGKIERNAYLLAGPTASGKSAIAAVLAREMGAVILSADSMLVYKGMDLGTAKPPPEEIAEFRMGGVDVVTPAEEFSSGAWLRAAAEWVKGVPEEVPIVIVGGTGLYFSALLRGLDKRLSDKINIPFHIAENPLYCVAKGTALALTNLNYPFLMR